MKREADSVGERRTVTVGTEHGGRRKKRCSVGGEALPRVQQIGLAPNIQTAMRTRILSVICCREAAANASSPYE